MKITDRKELTRLISFIAMCDGSIHKNGGTKNNVMSFSQTENHEDFVYFVKDILENITSTVVYRSKNGKSLNKNYKSSLKVQSKSHPFFNAIRDRIYTNTYKSIDPHALKLLDWKAMAIIYMCDGCLGKTERKTFSEEKYRYSYTTTINMCRLSYGDQLLLKKAIKEKLGIEFNVVKTGKKYFSLRLRMKDFDKFMHNVNPYILDSFKYKVELRTINPLEEGGEIV